ncbi:MAG: TIGR04255 family protein [Sulfuricella sp.]
MPTYPHHQTVSDIRVAVELSSEQTNKPIAEINQQENGHRLSTEDMTQLLMLWPSSFNLSQLAPYPGWDNFFDRFVRDWSIWKRTIGFQKISRIGVRYINRIDIPVTGTITKYEEFLNIYPKLPESLDPIFGYSRFSYRRKA